MSETLEDTLRSRNARLNTLRGVSDKVRSTAANWLNLGKVPPAAWIFADDEGAVEFEWEEGGISYSVRISEVVVKG